MAVASDLPQLENRQQYRQQKNSYLYDDHWRPIGIFAPPNHDVIDTYDQISTSMKDAIVAVEDKRFWSDPGVDIRGIARAFVADVTGGARQGASTIAQQFVKNALSEEDNRTILEKLREAALAYHLTRRVVEDEDPDRVPELDLLRKRRLRRRIGRARLLRQDPRPRPGRHATGDTNGCGRQLPGLRAPRCWPRGRRRCWPGWSPTRRRSTRSAIRRRPRRGATWCSRTCCRRATSARRSTTRASTSRCPPPPTSSSPRSQAPPPTSQAGCGPRSWPRWAGTASPPRWPSTAPTTAG